MSNRDLGKLYSSIAGGSLARRERFIVNEVLGNVTDPYAQPETQPDIQQPSIAQQYGAVIDTKAENAKKELIEDWLHSGGYSDGDGNVSNQVKGALEGYVDWYKLDNYVRNKMKDQVTLPVGEGEADKIDLMLYKQIEMILKDPGNKEHLNLIYMTLFSRTFAEGTVSVGRGELILTLFTSCKKGSVGDLEYMDSTAGVQVPAGEVGGDVIQVEVKTGRGRAYSSRQGGFRNANIEIEKAVLGAVNMSDDAVESDSTFLVVSDDGEYMLDVQPKLNNKGVIVGFTPINNEPDGMLSIEQFVAALENIDKKQLMGKNQFFKTSAGELTRLLGEKEKGISDIETIRMIRHRAASACILWGYAHKHFQYVLIIKQAGKNANVSTAASVDTGTFRDCAYIDCTNLDNIYQKMEEGILDIDRGGKYAPSKDGSGRSLDGEGVYVGYAGSNTDIDAIGAQSTFLSDVKRLRQQKYTKPSKRK